jgi:hypothetical protein
MTPGLLIISVYRPDMYEDAVKSIGVARDVVVILDRRVGERRRSDRAMGEASRRRDRRRLPIDDQLRTDGWVWISAGEREVLNAAAALTA